jgi:hypothetical protein
MSQLFKENLISTKDAARLSGYNPDYLARLCREEKIIGSQIGRNWFVDRSSLETFMSAQEERKREIAQELSKQRSRE